MNTPETLPAISEAEQLANAVKIKPTELVEQQIAASSLDQLDAAARVIEEKRIVIDGQARALIRARFEILKGQETTDEQLTQLSSRVHLMRLLEVKAPASTAPSSMDKVADVLRGIAERTTGIPVLKNITGFFKDLKGRTIERAWYNVLALFEKNPAIAGTAATATMGPTGALLGLFKFNFGGRRQLTRLDMLDAIDLEKLAGETITFDGVSATDMEKFRDKLASANIIDLTATYIRNQRKIVPAGQPIVVTLEAVLSPEQTQSKIAEQEVQTRKNRIIEAWKPLDIATVDFKSPVSAKKNGAGRFELTIPEAELDNGEPSSTSARKLQEAMTVLTDAKDITIVPEAERLTLNVVTKSAFIPVSSPALTTSVNRGFHSTNGRIERIVFGRPADMPTKPMQAVFDAGTLTLGAGTERLQALEQIAGLDGLLESAENGAVFDFSGGSWAPHKTPTPV